MKVYARYIQDNGLEYRFDTLLQFGESWELIGNVVLANPGSSSPLKNIDKTGSEEITRFFNEYRKGEQIDSSEWFMFSLDSTMQQIEKIFNGFYINDETKELNGVIQLFNCFNLKNQNLENAVFQLENIHRDDVLTPAEITQFFGNRPVYFGFSQSVLRCKNLQEVARSIFEKTPEELKTIYDEDFNKNKFYHPRYINCSYTRNERTKKIMKDFFITSCLRLDKNH